MIAPIGSLPSVAKFATIWQTPGELAMARTCILLLVLCAPAAASDWQTYRNGVDRGGSTDDGTAGFEGRVSEALDAFLTEQSPEDIARMVFYNCGPAPMIHASETVQRRFVTSDRIYSAIDYLTKCGVGICGACAAPDGRRICVDGPFISQEPDRRAV